MEDTCVDYRPYIQIPVLIICLFYFFDFVKFSNRHIGMHNDRDRTFYVITTMWFLFVTCLLFVTCMFITDMINALINL